MDSTSNRELINTAQGVLNPHTVGGRLFGNVASVLITATGNRFSGVCIDTGSGTGFCAEHSAIAAMVTAGEYQIAMIVAVWRDGDGLLYVLPPCGRCRQLLWENGGPAMVLDTAHGVLSMAQVLPHAFGREDLEERS